MAAIGNEHSSSTKQQSLTETYFTVRFSHSSLLKVNKIEKLSSPVAASMSQVFKDQVSLVTAELGGPGLGGWKL